MLINVQNITEVLLKLRNADSKRLVICTYCINAVDYGFFQSHNSGNFTSKNVSKCG